MQESVPDPSNGEPPPQPGEPVKTSKKQRSRKKTKKINQPMSDDLTSQVVEKKENEGNNRGRGGFAPDGQRKSTGKVEQKDATKQAGKPKQSQNSEKQSAQAEKAKKRGQPKGSHQSSKKQPAKALDQMTQARNNQPQMAQRQQSSNARQFPQHYLPQMVERGLENGSLASGTLRINPKKYEDAFVSNSDSSLPDYYVKGILARNRALHGDEVVIDILAKKDWCILHDRIRQYLDSLANPTPEDIALQMSSVTISKSSSTIDMKSTEEAENKESKPVMEENDDADIVIEEESVIINGKPAGTCKTTASKEEHPILLAEERDNGKDLENPGSDKSVKKTRRGKNRSSKKKKNLDEGKEDCGKKAQDVKKNVSGNNLRRLEEYIPEVQYSPEAVFAHPKCDSFLQKTARVVFISEKIHSRYAAGYLKPFKDNNQNFALFSPLDSRVPRMKIPMRDCPSQFLTRPDDFKNLLFIAEIMRWDQPSYALGRLAQNLGDSSDIEVRSKSILFELGIDDSLFSEEVEACLPPVPFVIPESELERRRNFKEECVFTIDPMTARDLDDALSVTDLGDGKYRVGVHIADVSYFVEEETALDKVAASRATSVYLVNRVIPMLPRTLCENLCSLNPDVDRLTFSVEWIMDADGTIHDQWFGRSVIKSCCKLAYEHAQSMLNEPDKEWKVDELPPISHPWTYRDLSNRVNILQKLALRLRQKREDNGALRLDLPKLTFSLNSESGLPQGYQLYEHRHSNKLIEEFMLLANTTVATKIESAFPEIAILRRHPPPKTSMLEELIITLDALGYEIDFSNSKSIASSLKVYQDQVNGPEERAQFQVLTNMVAKPMELAKYFCTGMLDDPEKYQHYALSVPLYTHFTSPIRRYPDILVHRLLDAALKHRPLDWNKKVLEKCAKNCNDMKLAAKTAGEKSAALYLGLFVKQCGPIQQITGVVMEVKDRSVDVLMIEMATVKRVYVDKVADKLNSEPILKFENGLSVLHLEWKAQEEGDKSMKQVLRIFSKVDLMLRADERPFEFEAILKRPLE